MIRRGLFARNRRFFFSVAPPALSTEDTTRPLGAALVAAIYLAGNTSCDDTGGVRADLPTFAMAEVRKHDAKEDMWVVYKRGVYDVTGFISQHPGGSKILLGAGKSIEPFWSIFGAHHRPDVYAMLEEYRIGNLDATEAAQAAPRSTAYANDPNRTAAFKVNSKEPFNAEPPGELLLSDFITPTELFFVRNHLPVPAPVDKPKLAVCPSDRGECREILVDDLKRLFPTSRITATLQCAGNRRSEMAAVKEVKGLSWDTCAIGTAEWGGARLADVLRYFGVDESKCHVLFEGRDLDAGGEPYGASIPLATALDPRKDVLLAYEMNGGELPRDHGHPLRVVVPGTVGARQVKFLRKIAVDDHESPSFWQQRDYRGFPPNVDYATADFSKTAGPSIQELPVQSAITEPAAGVLDMEDDDDDLVVKGYAWSGGGRAIVRVDVSADGGKTWTQADLSDQGTNQDYNRAWAWTPWEVVLPVPRNAANLDLACKAVDAAYNTQPEAVAPIWNMRGLLNNAYHRVHITLNRPDQTPEHAAQ